MTRKTLGAGLLALMALSWLTAAGRPFEAILSTLENSMSRVEGQLAVIEDELGSIDSGAARIVVVHKEFEATLYPSPGIQVVGLTQALRIPSELSGTLLQVSCQPLFGFGASFRARWNGNGETVDLCNSPDGWLHNDDVDLPVEGGESVALECFGEDIGVERPCSVQVHLWLELERGD